MERKWDPIYGADPTNLVIEGLVDEQSIIRSTRHDQLVAAIANECYLAGARLPTAWVKPRGYDRKLRWLSDTAWRRWLVDWAGTVAP